jgi:hypothetical protein
VHAAAQEVLEQQPNPSHVAPKRRKKRKLAMHQVVPAEPEQPPRQGLGGGLRVGLFGVGALLALAAAYFVGRRFVSAHLPKVQKVSHTAWRHEDASIQPGGQIPYSF